MRFVSHQQDPPRLRTRGPQDSLLSKDWRARGATQRIGATVFATVLLFGSVALVAACVLLRIQVSEAVGGISGQVLGSAIALFPFLIACVLTFLAIRLIKGISRSFRR